MVGRQTPLLALFVPLILVGMVDGMRGIRQTWPAAIVGGVVFAVAQFATSNYISVELTDIVASLLATARIVLLLRGGSPSEPLLGERAEPRRAAAARPWPGAADARPRVRGRRAPAPGGRRTRHAAGDRPGLRALPHHHRDLRPGADRARSRTSWQRPTQEFTWPGLDVRNADGEPVSSITYTFNWLAAAGTLLLIAGADHDGRAAA